VRVRGALAEVAQRAAGVSTLGDLPSHPYMVLGKGLEQGYQTT